MNFFKNLTILGVGMLTCCGASDSQAKVKKVPGSRTLQIEHAELGHKIDKIYYDAGTQIDEIIFDLKELRRQGNKQLDAKIDELKIIDKQFRQSWLGLEKERKELAQTITNIPPAKANILKIQSLEETGGIFGWFGMHSAKILWADGKELNLPLKSFIHGDLIKQYKVFVSAADMLCIRSLHSENSLAMAGFDLSAKPVEKSKLIIAAIDCDKPGTTKIKISLNDNVIFSGPNPFKKFKWTTHEFPIDKSFYNSKKRVIDYNSTIIAKLNKLKHLADVFRQKAQTIITQQELATKAVRTGLVYKNKTINRATWLNSYIRGIDVNYYNGSAKYQNQFVYPGSYMDLEYMGKLIHDMDITSGWQVGVDARKKVVIEKIKKYNLPSFLWTDGTDLVDGDIVSFYYLEHKAEALKELKKLNKKYFNNYQQLHGLYIDEPVIHDSYKRYGSITNKPFFRQQFFKYLTQRAEYLKAHKITIPNSDKAIKLPPAESSPLWMEWQIFKKEFAANHWAWLYQAAKKDDITLPVLLMDKNGIEPQSASWVSYGKKLPLLMTDLYGNGSVSEAYNMQMFASAVQGKAIMTPGAGYSCKTVDRFKRSLSIAATHGSGIYIWTYSFLSKYRDANYFWRTGGKKSNVLLNYWNPGYWAITETMFEQMKNADQLLAKGKSTAKIVYLVSESSIISGSKKNKSSMLPRSIKSHNMGVYGYLVETGKPFDVCFIESMSAEKLKQYKLAILFVATTLKDSEVKMIRDWTKQGGVLISSGTSSLYDEWGRQRKNYALSDVFGVDYLSAAKNKDTSFKAFSIVATYPNIFNIIKVKKHHGAVIAGAFNNGDAALVKNHYGAGTSFLMTSERPGWIKSAFPVKRSALWGKSYPGFDKLLSHIIKHKVAINDIVSMQNHLGDDIAMSIKQLGNRYIVHFIDWQDSRTVSDLKIKLNLPGSWKVYYPGDKNGINQAQIIQAKQIFTLRDFKIHEMIVLEKQL